MCTHGLLRTQAKISVSVEALSLLRVVRLTRVVRIFKMSKNFQAREARVEEARVGEARVGEARVGEARWKWRVWKWRGCEGVWVRGRVGGVGCLSSPEPDSAPLLRTRVSSFSAGRSPAA